MTRDEKVREARRLRALGWTAPEIGRELGVSDSTVRNWCLGGDCADCGAPLDGSERKKALRCSSCNGHIYGGRNRDTGVVGQALAFFNEPRRYSELRDHLGISNGYAAQLLYGRLVAQGQVRRVSRGVYERVS